MNWKRVETLVGADVDRVVSMASDAGAALAALTEKIRAEADTVEAARVALGTRIDAIPAEIADQQTLMAKCDAIIAKAEGEGRSDLAAAARAKKAGAADRASVLQAERATAEADVARADEALAQLRDKAAEVDGRLEGLGVADTQPAVRVPGDAEVFGAPSAPAAPAASPPSHAAAVEAPPVAAVPAAAVPAAAAPAASGDEDLDAAFAELMAGMGDLEDDAPTASEPDDDDALALPDLVEVSDDELPEGANPDDDGPIDFSAIDALAAMEAGRPAPKPKKASPPAKWKEAKAPAKEGAGKPPAAAGEKPSKRGLWIAVGGAALAIGGTLAALIGFGVL